jgi:hypothetical protein
MKKFSLVLGVIFIFVFRVISLAQPNLPNEVSSALDAYNNAANAYFKSINKVKTCRNLINLSNPSSFYGYKLLLILNDILFDTQREFDSAKSNYIDAIKNLSEKMATLFEGHRNLIISIKA